MDDKKTSKSTTRTILSYMTPARAIGRALDSVGKTKDVLVQTAHVMGQALPGQAAKAEYPEGDLRNITNAKERFEAMYETHEWSEKELVGQIRTLRITKITAMIMGIFSFAGVFLIAAFAPLWVAIFMIPASGVMLILGMAQAFKYALYEAQIKLREFISAREFVAREDFWTRLFG